MSSPLSFPVNVCRYPCILFLLVLLSFPHSVSAAAGQPFTPVGTVILDAGHGGHDPGALGTWDGQQYTEKDFALDITLRVRDILLQRAPDVNVMTTRDTDVYLTLDQRADFAIQRGPSRGTGSIFVSIHINSAINKDADGYEVLIKKNNKLVTFLDERSPLTAIKQWSSYRSSELNRQLNIQNQKLAEHVISTFSSFFPMARNRGIVERDIYVLNYSRTPSVLIEVGFLSNESDARNLRDEEWRQKTAAAIATAILAYRNL